MQLSAWAADGKGLFVSNRAKEGTEIAYVDLQGNTHLVWKSNGRTGFAVPSPDGRHIGINTFEGDYSPPDVSTATVRERPSWAKVYAQPAG
jgi:Tol biopolymer transport system component